MMGWEEVKETRKAHRIWVRETSSEKEMGW
jgi:hypothetical protein